MGEEDATATPSSVLAIAADLLNLSLAVIQILALFLALILVPHIYRILKPSIVAYPWDEGRNRKNREESAGAATSTSTATVVFAASYNPPHYGHLRMLEYLSTKYGRVIAVVGFNPNKKYPVSPEERADLLREMLKLKPQTEHVVVEVVEGYIWRYAKRVGATLFFRGIRSWEKDGKDERFLQILNTWGPLLYGPLAIPIPTVYIEGDPKYNHVSSTLIRSICDIGGGEKEDEQTRSTEALLSELVPAEVARKVATFYGTTR